MVRAIRPASVALGLLVDRAVGEPPLEPHPVAAFGQAMGELEARCWADRRLRGAAFAGVGIGVGVASGVAVGSTALGVGVAAAGSMLREQALGVAHLLDDGDLGGARRAVPALVGRDASDLDPSGLAAAVVESVAENTVDAVVAPALWGLLLGAPGALGHRAVNTLDAMVGHHGDRYERFGWASARADDVANWVPARVTAGLVMAAQPRGARRVLAAVQDGAGDHPSPNAGVAEAAFAGALAIELGGPLRYASRVEDRPRLGAGPRPQVGDIRRAVRLESQVEWLLVGLLAVAGATAGVMAWRRR